MHFVYKTIRRDDTPYYVPAKEVRPLQLRSYIFLEAFTPYIENKSEITIQKTAFYKKKIIKAEEQPTA